MRKGGEVKVRGAGFLGTGDDLLHDAVGLEVCAEARIEIAAVGIEADEHRRLRERQPRLMDLAGGAHVHQHRDSTGAAEKIAQGRIINGLSGHDIPPGSDASV